MTINAKGQVIAGGSIGASDVTAALGYTPYSAANPSGYVTAASIAASLSHLAPLASPGFTGTPTAPTPAAADNSAALATTAFVQAHAPSTTGIAGNLNTYRVLDFGAFFDGVHDDQPGIEAAIAAANAAGGGTVLLPAGHGVIGNTIVQPYNNVHLVGVGIAQPLHLGKSGYDACTVLSWIGAPGGIMLLVGPAQNTINGRNVSNTDVRGILFDCATLAGVGIQISSVDFSDFDLGYYQPLQCGVRFATVLLQAAQSATATTIEVNDCQHNQIKIIGTAINSTGTTVATAVAAGGSASVAVASASGFVVGMQVRVGVGLYILQSISSATLTFATPVSATDGVAGAAAVFAPRGVWLHGLTPDLLPAGFNVLNIGSSTQQYPAVWIGNVSGNQFRSVVLDHYTAGDGFTFGFSDHNAIDKIFVYSNAGAMSIVFDASNTVTGPSIQNKIDYCAASMIVARGTTSHTFPSVDSAIERLDGNNGTSTPIVETGAKVHFANAACVRFSPQFVNPVVYEAFWEPLTSTISTSTSTSLTVLNNVSDHIRLAVPLSSTPSWSIAIFGQDLAIRPLSGTTGVVQVGEGAGVNIIGSLSVAGALTGPTPAASDNSTKVATTAWVTSQGYIAQVANITALRALAVAGLADGAALMVDAYAVRADNGGGLFTWNATATAADNGGSIVNPNGNTGNGRWVRQLGGQRVTPQMFGAKGDGATDDTAAFNAALAAGPIYVPASAYIVANVTVPNGALIEGDVGLGYTGDIGKGTPTSLQTLTPVRPILIAKAGTSTCILNVFGNIDAIIKGVFLDGGANGATCDGISSGSTRLTMERVTVVRCVNGLGSVANADLYTHVATIIDCEFANNTNGVANLIDSVMIGGAVSANVVGVNLGSGGNANNFIGARFEWNSQDGLQGFQAASNQVVGGLFDRNSWRGVNLGAGCKDWTFTGVQFARNGVANVYPNNSHIALNGTSSVFFTGCITRTGTNDDGSGILSPAYVFNYINTNALVTISSSDVSGFTAGAFNGANPTAYVQRDNDGGGDTIVTAARPYFGSGVAAQTLVTKASANVTPGQSTTIAIGQSPLTNNFSVIARELIVTATNFNTPFQSCAARFDLAFYRDTAIHTPSASTAYGEAGGTGIVTWGGSGKLQLSASSVASDGSSWTLGVLNGGTGDGSNWGVWAELR